MGKQFQLNQWIKSIIRFFEKNVGKITFQNIENSKLALKFKFKDNENCESDSCNSYMKIYQN